MNSPFETIVAPITGVGHAAVAVLRLSGPESWAIASRVFAPWPEPVQPRFANYGRFATGDDGLCLPFEQGQSYTGEESVELSVHGSRASVSSLIEACLAEGARMARPGEFTERAFLNGRMDLTQAEGVRDTVEALTSTQLRQANLMREGALRRQVREASEKVALTLAFVEATVDFSEEIGPLDKPDAIARLGSAQAILEQLINTAEAGRILRQGFRIAIVGPPNAGKSTLLNRLLGYDRAIVTEFPGTTRDFVEERLDLGGIPCVITDTAGLRATEDPIETLGIERSGRVVEAADEVWYVFDAAAGWTEDDALRLTMLERPSLVLQNKSDLLGNAKLARGAPADALPISAQSGNGIDRLIATVSDRLKPFPSDAVWINDRHRPLLESASGHLFAAAATLGQDLPVDLVSVHLQAALMDLGQITGEQASEDVLDRVFGEFCIGK